MVEHAADWNVDCNFQLSESVLPSTSLQRQILVSILTYFRVRITCNIQIHVIDMAWRIVNHALNLNLLRSSVLLLVLYARRNRDENMQPYRASSGRRG